MLRSKLARIVLSFLLLGTLATATIYLKPIDSVAFGDSPLPAVLRIGVLPDESPRQLRRKYAPLLDYLSENLQIACKLVIPATYDELLSMFAERRIDFAYFGGLTYIKAQQQVGAVPLVMRKIDTRFTSYFLVAGDSEVESLQDLRGKTISFGSKLSTSGHLMPRFFLGKQNIDPESFFAEIEYSGSHDKTAYRIRDREADLGAANAATVRSMLTDGRLASKDIRILWETPPYADYVWAIQPGYEPAAREKLRNAFLLLTPEIEGHAIILAGVNAQGFIPADADYFRNLEQIVRQSDQLLTADRE